VGPVFYLILSKRGPCYVETETAINIPRPHNQQNKQLFRA